jgi:hypothetical protein
MTADTENLMQYLEVNVPVVGSIEAGDADS